MAQSARSEAGRWADCFDELPEPERATALAIRDLVREVLRERAPQAKQAVKWGYAAWVLGAKSGGNMCSIMGAQGYVRLQFFRGAELDDPSSALRRHGQRHAPPQGPLRSTATPRKPCARSSRPPSRCTPSVAAGCWKTPTRPLFLSPPRCGGRCHVVAEGGPPVPEQIRYAVASGLQPPLPSASPPAVRGERGERQQPDFFSSLLGPPRPIGQGWWRQRLVLRGALVAPLLVGVNRALGVARALRDARGAARAAAQVVETRATHAPAARHLDALDAR